MSFFRSVRKAAATGFNYVIEARARQARNYIRVFVPDSVFQETRHEGYDLGATAQLGRGPGRR